ncbi:uncharacterized protein LOC130949596 [Arachis stenosperma]|uniref:uncharacterized protein LOC130949596 n=1 Tax=Arachis stenosperma TaxID=217475 RepID=UPI0025AD214F|nr:uncharacterized protein LOC130949596 [Arachis stenosperma]
MEEQPQEQRKMVKPSTPSLPYPQRFNNELKDQQFPKFLEVFKKLEINISLAEALEQMPLYAKFLKELINKKRCWDEKETVMLTQECSAVIQRGIPPKLKDPGSFVISCTIGKITLEKALCDLGASINLMPLSMMKKLAIEEIKPTRMSLVMADRSIKIPNGVMENLLVKVREFIFPADFVIMDTEEEGNNSIILGRHFLATTRAIIDVEKEEMIFRVHNEQMIISIFKSMQHPPEQENYMRVDMIEGLVEEEFEAISQEEQGEEIKIAQDTLKEQVTEASSERKAEEKPSQELKPLPPHLKYAFLGTTDNFPVIINSTLSEEEEGRLLDVLRTHKDALGWTIDDLKGISLAIYIANYKVGRKIPQEFTKQQVKKLLNEAKKFLWDKPFLFKRCLDGMIRKCVPENEMKDILWHCHGSAYGGHFGPERTTAKVLQSRFYWPTIFKDAREFVHLCNECQKAGGLTRRNEMP